ncbi:MAG: enoyl-CoA hydratase-related protein [Acidimicrobiales bacterium]
MITFAHADNLFVLGLGDGDNRFNAETIGAINDALDVVEASEGPAALITMAEGKIWHNGLDLDYMATLGGDVGAFLASVERLYARLLTLRVPTIAAVQGHCFAGGAMFALAHDHRIMREDRGFFCLPEIDLGMSFTDGMAALIAPRSRNRRCIGFAVGRPGWRANGPGAGRDRLDDHARFDRGRCSRTRKALAPKAGNALVALRQNFYGTTIATLS